MHARVGIEFNAPTLQRQSLDKQNNKGKYTNINTTQNSKQRKIQQNAAKQSYLGSVGVTSYDTRPVQRSRAHMSGVSACKSKHKLP